MFARVITMQLKSDKLDEAAKNYREIGPIRSPRPILAPFVYSLIR